MLRKALLIAGTLTLIAVPSYALATNQPEASVQFGAEGAVTDPAVEDHIYPGARAIDANGTVNFNVDGVHQPLLYRLHDGESLDEAHTKLEARASELQGTTPRRRMAGAGQFAAAVGIDSLTAADRAFGFTYLSGQQVPPPVVQTVSATSLISGKYIMLCNVRVHYQNFDMFGLVNVQKAQPASTETVTAHAHH